MRKETLWLIGKFNIGFNELHFSYILVITILTIIIYFIGNLCNHNDTNIQQTTNQIIPTLSSLKLAIQSINAIN